MSTAKTFLVVGGGKMGEAIVSGWLSCATGAAGAIQPGDVTIVEPSETRREYLEDAHGVSCCDAVEHASHADVVLLAVKPQVLMGVLEDIARLDAFKGAASGPLFVSIAAGIETARIAGKLPQGAPVVRVMPNMPLQVSAGASGVCKGENASDEQVSFVADLFGCIGRAVVVDESDMDAVCALSGSGPAYVAALVEAMRDAACRQGLDSKLAETLALQTVLGTARLIDETELTPASAREAVCSPGGTTLAALEAMEKAGFAQSIDDGIAAAVRRSRELAECS